MSKPRWRPSEKSWEADCPVDDVQGISQKQTPDSWELIETSRLQQQLGLLLKPIDECDETSECGEFPGLIARRRLPNPVIVALGYSVEPQQVLALTNPVIIGRQPPEDVADGIEKLLNLAIQIACRERCQWIRILLSDSVGEPESSSGALRKALSSNDFSCLAQIGEWHRAYSPEDRHVDFSLRSRTACELLTVDQLRDSDLRSEVRRLLEDVLTTSRDLPKLPQPSATEKLSQWLNEGSEILIWRTDSVAAGICVVAISSTKDAVLPVVIKYVGVAPQFRQQQIASRLIRWMAAHYLENVGSAGMTVTADQSNIAAVRLYESLGFQRQSSHDVWIRRIGETASSETPAGQR